MGSDCMCLCRNEPCTIGQKPRESERERSASQLSPFFESSPRLAKIITPIYKLSTRRNRLKGPSSRLPGKAMAAKYHKKCTILHGGMKEFPAKEFQWQGKSMSVEELKEFPVLPNWIASFSGGILRTLDINCLYVGPSHPIPFPAVLITSGAWPT